MTDKEIKALMTRAQNSDGSSSHFEANLFWVCCIISLMASTSAGISAIALSALFAIMAIMPKKQSKKEELLWRHDYALRTWRLVCKNEPCFQPDSPATARLKAQILQIYFDDPRGDSFPLPQALRLLEVAFSMQKRLERITTHIHGLEDHWGQLSARLERLRMLGEDNPQGQTQLARLRRDIDALGAGTVGLKASCDRLEKVVASVHERAEVKRLQHEIGQLSNAPTSPLPDTDATDLGDLERQITHEIETFLQLERETDAHLREL